VSHEKQIRAIKGVRDILPPETALWNRVERTTHEVFATYGFGEIRLPVFEERQLFVRSIGIDTDVVSKEMFTVSDRTSSYLSDLQNFVTLGVSQDAGAGEWAEYANRAELFCAAIQNGRNAGEISINEEKARILGDLQGAVRELVVLSGRGASFLPELRPKLTEALHRVIEGTFRLEIVDSYVLRPEATASACRAYIEHGMHTWPQPVKLYYLGPMFRRERPQKGRYRQFYQIGAEVLTPTRAGEDNLKADAAIDAEVIEMLVALFERVGLVGTMLSVNSIGCKDCRPKYVELLRAELRKVRGQLGEDSQRRIETNPLRVLDSKLPAEQTIIEKLPRIGDHLCAACKEHFAALQEQLKLRGIVYEINWRLVRGLDYYMRTTFEITAPGLGSQNAVCGGGRYDGLVELLGGPPTKGIGFAIGEDRVILALQEAGNGNLKPSLDAFIAWMGAASYLTAVRVARRLRAEGFAVELPAEEMKFKKSLGLADKLGARYAVIIGEDEVASEQFTLKRLADAEQKKLGQEELIAALKAAG
jgi:histidyl-tRNA synthetase